MILPRLSRRPILIGALAAGAAGWALAWLLGTRGTTAALLAWDAAAVTYAAAILAWLWNASPKTLQERAARLDEDQWTILLLCVAAALVSLVAVGADLAATKGTPGANQAAILAGGTVMISWLFVQVLFAHHYAHAHWLRGSGLDFPGNDQPDFPEFLYFAMTVGMTAQVSDVTTRSAGMRRLVLGHGLLAFLFNAVVVAAAVNLAAALVG
ncbi:DUF1345 domain-containing protein [Roseomonas chloroacetimidivorans]|uniref:DUF1345 domain-containing protein n=1 Tax=Roseomonas chloroacetimidivorans TaxID=1766656 RepID=UPI003C729F57